MVSKILQSKAERALNLESSDDMSMGKCLVLSDVLLQVMELKETVDQLSLVVKKTAFCIRENKEVDQLRGNREADQRLCFRYTDSTIPLLPKSESTSF